MTKPVAGDRSSLHSLHQRLFLQPTSSNFTFSATETKPPKLKLPPLPQKHFYHLWRSLHDLVSCLTTLGLLEDLLIALGVSSCS